MARQYITNLDTEEVPWTVGAERHRHVKGGWVQPGPEYLQQLWFFKELSIDDETGAATMLFKNKAGLCSRAAGYHPVTEEAFFIEGEIRAFEDSPFVPSIYKSGHYFFRPPGWVHDGDILKQTLIFRAVSGHDARISCDYLDIGRNKLLLSTADAVEPRGYLRCLNSNDLPWINSFEFVSEHNWEIALEHTLRDRLWFKLLSKDRNSGAATGVVRMDEEFILPTAGFYTSPQELYILEGELTIGNHVLHRGSYVYRPRGFVEGPIRAIQDSVILFRYDARVQRIETSLQDVDQDVLADTSG
ncbi:MAG TPA: hypothetical protein VGX03_13130 [Candidatus Binatia bacterium]|jgi:hypothetical protein|nr:hypothetical protein [Candidatus Binatia bacterium]